MSDSATTEMHPHAHPLARRLMLQLAHHSEADARVVFAALVQRLQPDEHDSRRASAILALTRCAEELAVERPSAARYAAWRTASTAGALAGAPTTAQIHGMFDGSWLRATAALPHVAGPNVLAHRLTATPRYTVQECLEALRRWHEQTGQTTGQEYCAWARDQRGSARDVRLPAASDAYRRRFGCWEDDLVAAGIDYPRAALPKRRLGRPRARNATRAEIINALHRAYVALGEPFTSVRYDAWARQQAFAHATNAGRGQRLRIPGHRQVAKMYGSWADTVNEIFADSGGAHAVAARVARRYTRDELAASPSSLATRSHFPSRPPATCTDSSVTACHPRPRRCCATTGCNCC